MNFDLLPLSDTVKPYMPIVVNFTYAIAIFIIGWFASKLVHRLVITALHTTRVEEALARFLASIAQYIVLAATVIASLNRVGVQTTSLVALLASAGLAVGLALQGSLSNFASGVMILGFRPFILGDVVEIGGKSGSVADIGLFMTRLVTANNETILVPNSSVTGGIIVNYTALGVRRAVVEVGVAYGEDVRKVQRVLREVAESLENSLKDPAPSVALDNFGPSSLNFQVRAYAKTDTYWGMLEELKMRIYEALSENEIDIPFNQIVVHQATEVSESERAVRA